MWSNYRSSRILLNQEDLEMHVDGITRGLEQEYNVPVRFKSVNLAELKFADQVKVMGINLFNMLLARILRLLLTHDRTIKSCYWRSRCWNRIDDAHEYWNKILLWSIGNIP